MSSPRNPLEARVLGTIRRHAMLAGGQRVLVGLSGGQDSLCLLLTLYELRDELGVAVQAAHLHHGMRGEEADADQQFVQELCAGLQVPLHTRRVGVAELARERGITLEEAGRAARREFLEEMAEKEGCARIALGHTATDRAETVLMNILRGTGLDGLVGIRPVNGHVIRPLIALRREETGAYCAARGLAPRVDRTNLDTRYLRNRVRLRLMPLLALEYAPGVQEALLRLAEAAEQELAWTEPLVGEALAAAARSTQRELTLALEPLCTLPAGLARRVLRRAIGQVAGGLTGFTMEHILRLEKLARFGRTGARVALPFAVWAERGYNELVLRRGEGGKACGGWQVVLEVPGRAKLPLGGELSAEWVVPPTDLRAHPRHEAFLEASVVGDRLTVRGWRAGDRIAPIGLRGTKKLQDLFVDRKVPRRERQRVPLVLNAEGEVLWVAGLCVSRVGAVRPGATRCAHLVWHAER